MGQVKDWTSRFGFGQPRSTNLIRIICIHVTVNAPGTPAENVANYQIRSESGSYHELVDAAGNVLIENTDDWLSWSAGPKGNWCGLHRSFVMRGTESRAEWLKYDAMLRAGAKRDAAWAKKYNIPAVKISPAELRAGKRGFCGHHDVSLAWGESDHVDPGAGFPWDYYLQLVREYMHPAHKPPQGGTPMTDLSGVSAAANEARDRLRAQDAPITSIVNPDVKFSPRDLAAVQDLNGWCTLVIAKAIARKLGLDPEAIISSAIADDRARTGGKR